jgi:anhydro-N-acetylmuramic acid kinase
LLAVLCNDEYLKRSPPKSTGKEYFNLEWLERGLKQIAGEVAPVDVQRTLIELTTSTISDALLANAARCTELLVCGGGARNPLIWQSLAAKLPETTVLSTKSRGVEPDYVEAMTFAWLASQTLNARPGNLPSVTGAAHEVILGAIYPGRQYLGQTQI